MDWNEVMRVNQETILPALEEWAATTGDDLTVNPLTEAGIPNWLALKALEHRGHNRGFGPIGSLLLSHALHSSVTRHAYPALAVVLGVRHGTIGVDDPEERDFILSLEAPIRRFGPMDSLAWSKVSKPIYVARDSLGRPHCEFRPAIEFRDRCYYALRGMQLSEQEWHHRDDPKYILEQVTNVESRRVLIERIGISKFFQEAGLEPFHTDRFGSLYRVEGGAYVHVVCPSTGKEYHLAVPMRCRTAHEAVAWTFSLVPEDYLPEQEA